MRQKGHKGAPLLREFKLPLVIQKRDNAMGIRSKSSPPPKHSPLGKCGPLVCVLVSALCTACWKFLPGVCCFVYMLYIELVATVCGFRKGGGGASLAGWGVKGLTAAAGGLSCLGRLVWSWLVGRAPAEPEILCWTWWDAGGVSWVGGFCLLPMAAMVRVNFWGLPSGLTSWEGSWLAWPK